eukprot:CAMPEP_0179017592 /NCGR_PEP_ID=MMETSP0796-20121207/3917_1 /TAXON_ID=73915 /ORGANISM="Pyrodinium bahamense, Strain pbaha01" /LENGTH=62 /DNA_ID=CAMNT_0020713323 /DNA_START=63 /DNA_END=247 /DNA_ORIENTATION=-
MAAAQPAALPSERVSVSEQGALQAKDAEGSLGAQCSRAPARDFRDEFGSIALWNGMFSCLLT